MKVSVVYDSMEAFEEHGDNLCVPRQLAVLLKMTLQDTCAAFDNICDDGWRARGVTPRRSFSSPSSMGAPASTGQGVRCSGPTNQNIS